MEGIGEVTVLDHAIAAVLVLVVPLLARRSFARLRERLADGDREWLTRTYRRTIGRQAVIGLAVVAAWILQRRSLASLGLAWPSGGGFWLGVAIAVFLLAYAVGQVRAVSRSEELRERMRERFEATGLAYLLPRSRAEFGGYTAVALSAGVWEELLYRGFLIAWFAHWIGVPLAILAAAVAFGLGHLYQGTAGVLKTGVAGLVAGLLYLLTGSLWIPMLLHTAVDLHAGSLGYLTFRPDGSSDAESRDGSVTRRRP